MHDEVTNLTQLGSKKTEYGYAGPHAGMLETFPNTTPHRDYHIRHNSDEFTSLCPKTGQPDFASIELEYVADQACLETKSVKLYWFAFRQEGAFMETLTNRMLEDFVKACSPRWMKVTGAFNARGGIATTVVAEYTKGA